MLNGVFGTNPNLAVNNNNKANNNSTSSTGGADFKSAFVDLAARAAAQLAVTEKGVKEQLTFGNWRELEDSLYYDKDEVEEKATLDNLKKLQRILKEKLGA